MLPPVPPNRLMARVMKIVTVDVPVAGTGADPRVCTLETCEPLK